MRDDFTHIEEAWINYRSNVLDHIQDKRILNFCRDLFYAGAAGMYEIAHIAHVPMDTSAAEIDNYLKESRQESALSQIGTIVH